MSTITTVTLSREELYNLIWQEPIVTIAKKLEVLPADVRQACKNYDIPVPEFGYWQKLKFNKHVNHYPLPAYSDNGDIVLKKLGNKEDKQLKTKVIVTKIDKVAKNDEKASKPYKLVVEAEKLLKSKDRHSYKGLINTWGDVLSINVSQENINRALAFYNTLIKSLNVCGYKVLVENRDTKLIVSEEIFKVALREKQKRIKRESRSRWDSYDYEPTGILVLKWDYYSGKEWSDGKVKIEEQIPAIIVWFEEQAAKIKVEREESKRRQEEHEREKQRKQEEQKRIENEFNNFKELIEKSRRYRDAIMIREYIDSLQQAKNENQELQNAEWISWARKKADWYDPNIEAEDELMKGVDKTTLTFKKKEWWEY